MRALILSLSENKHCARRIKDDGSCLRTWNLKKKRLDWRRQSNEAECPAILMWDGPMLHSSHIRGFSNIGNYIYWRFLAHTLQEETAVLFTCWSGFSCITSPALAEWSARAGSAER